MKHINIILGNHNHQPVGNFDFCIEETYKRAYKPFLDLFKGYPSVKMVFHYTGCLLQWLEENHKEHIDEIAALVKEGRLEMSSGAFYEPIISIIPESDRHEQIIKLNEYLKNRFGVVPKGAWIAERVWEQSLVGVLAKAGLEYVALDDFQFLPTGIKRENMFGYYSTDDLGRRINVFPISQNLRYLIPFKELDEIVEYLQSVATEDGDRLLVLHDDGEKYGDWPGTYKWVYEDKWLINFFDMLEKNKDWIHTTTYKEYMQKYPPLERIYIPCASYQEMLTWVLPAKEQNIFHDAYEKMKTENPDALAYMRGGFWRNYQRKYSESNRLHKRMLYTSNIVDSMKDGAEKEKAKDYLFKSQCNCPYWHGTFGGLYLNHLRHTTYKNFIEATRIAEESVYGKSYFRMEERDFDFDGINEYIVSSENQFIVIDSKNAAISEWDVKGKNPTNLIDTLTRREEAYHKDMLSPEHENKNEKEHVSIHEMKKKFDKESLEYLVFDKNEKLCAVDHFIDHIVDARDFNFLRYEERASFLNSRYKIAKTEKKNDKVIIEFENDGNVLGFPVKLTKKYTVGKNNDIHIDYAFENKSENTLTTVFAMENNITLLAGEETDRFYFHNNTKIERLSSFGEVYSKDFGIEDDGYLKIKVLFEASEKVNYLYMPCYTISDAVDHLEKLYQHSTIAVLLPLSIKSKEKKTFSIKIKTSEANK